MDSNWAGPARNARELRLGKTQLASVGIACVARSPVGIVALEYMRGRYRRNALGGAS